MAFWDRWFAKNRVEPAVIPAGRVTEPAYGVRQWLSPYRSRTADILETLRAYTEETAAIDFLRRVTPDLSMAVWNFLRLSNQGHDMHFYDIRERGRRLPRAESQWREFAARVNQISNAGLDGLIDQLHQSAFLRGAMALEVEVNAERTDVEDVHPVVPQTVSWELEDRGGRRLWIPYQRQTKGDVSLEPGKANFYWVPVDPDIDDPRGNLIMAPVLQAIDFQLQILQDLQAVLHHQGWPRNDIVIILERLKQAMPPDVKANAKKQREWLQARWSEVNEMFDKLNPDSDYLHFDDVQINMAQGANAGRSLDVRAIQELVDTQMMSGAKQLAVFLNRNSGVTETWGTVQFRIFASGLASVQRGSKRLVEEVARLWLRVRGIQGIPVFEHRTIDWESEEQRMNVRLLQQQFHVIAQLMGWETADQAAQEVVGAESAASGTPSEAIRISLQVGGDRIVSAADDGKGGLYVVRPAAGLAAKEARRAQPAPR